MSPRPNNEENGARGLSSGEAFPGVSIGPPKRTAGKRRIAWLQLSLMEFVIVAGLFLLSAILFLFISHEVMEKEQNQLDAFVFHLMAGFTSPRHTAFARAITFFGSAWFLIPSYLVLIGYYFAVRKNRDAILLFFVAAISILSGGLLKLYFHRARPLSPLIPGGVQGFSFPSGHSLGAFTFSGILIGLILWGNQPRARKWLFCVILFLFAWLVALSRIYLRAHFASDVLGSFMVTIVWLSLAFVCFNFIRRRRPEGLTTKIDL